MKRFEYKIYMVDSWDAPADLETKLNVLGKMGWEMAYSYGKAIVFKREEIKPLFNPYVKRVR